MFLGFLERAVFLLVLFLKLTQWYVLVFLKAHEYLAPTRLSSGRLRHRLNLTLGATENRLFRVRLRFEKSVFLSLSEGAVLSLVLLLKVNQ